MTLRLLHALPLFVLACGPKTDEPFDDDSTSSPLTETGATSLTTTDPTNSPDTTTTEPTQTDPDTTTPEPTQTDPGTTTNPSGDPPDDQTPPQGREQIEVWLAEGHYKAWHCQPAVVDPIPISPHGKQRICSNDVLSGHGTGEYPVGSAGVKELYDEAGVNIIGYAVYLHITAGTSGANWYWYERVPLDSPAPHDENGVVADGDGGSGPAMAICVGCHSAAGLDAAHPGHDFVYSQI